jgi:hypothetical protein
MTMRHRALVLSLLATFVCASFVFAQRSQPSPGVGNAVLLATNSIQLDKDTSVLSGDVIVNNATVGAVLGELALSLDKNATTPAGYKLAATSVDLDQGASAGGDVYYNTLANSGSIAGALFTPLAIPVFASLPPVLVRPFGSANVVIANNAVSTLGEGAYGDLVIGKNAKLTLLGGGYAFRSITVGSGSQLRYSAPADVVVSGVLDSAGILVGGRADFGASSVLAPADGSGLTPAGCRLQVGGINGSNGALLSTPPAVHLASGVKAYATIFATSGSLILDSDIDGNGAFLGRDVFVGHGTHLTLNSAFNQPPLANSQVVVTSGTTPLLITLTGSDPEGSALTFSIVSGPTAGTLSPLVPNSPTSASATYTPAAPNVPDSFTFRVRDTAGATGDAVVTINPASADTPPPNPTTVVANDGSAQTTKDVAATLLLTGAAPAGVPITFSIVSGTGPSHGSLGSVTQGAEVPQRSATVVYTPNAGYTGPDTFDFQACGVISSVTVCDTGTFSITVLAPLSDPPLIAHDVEASTSPDTPVVVTLGDSSIQSAVHHRIFASTPTLHSAAIAGNVADADANGLGDNVNALPGAAPVFMSAGVNQAGSAGSGGTVRMQFEWDMSSIVGSLGSLTSAQVVLPTNRGTVDSLDTFFYWVSASGDGNLTNSDFESPAQQIAGVVMPVPPEMQIGADGSFAFSVLSQLQASSSFSFFAIQGRVDEINATSGRGLQVRTTASGNQTSNTVPTLALTTSTVTPLSYRITSLPFGGVLRDSANQVITTVPYDLPSPQVTYTPNTGFLGLDTFNFSVSNGITSASALAKINVSLANCATNPAGCNNGR